MEKIYGYKEKDVLELAQYIQSKKAQPLSKSFLEYALEHGKAKGTVRNLYYALAKKSNVDDEFCQKYLGGQKFTVGKIVEFKKDEEEKLIKTILKEKANGKSVRKTINELANGDEKVALRYQNKYRNFIKNSPEIAEKYSLELLKKSEKNQGLCQKELFNEFQLKKIKVEINKLVENISLSVKKENDKLKAKNAYLERENAKLKQELGIKNNCDHALNYFIKKNANRVFS